MELRPEKQGSKNKKKAGGLAAKLAGKQSSASMMEETKEKTPEELKAEILELKKQLASGGGESGIGSFFKEDLNTKPVLGYWKTRGLGAQIRYMFAYLNIEFEDKTYELGDAPDFDKS